ncbi:MAG: replicative DNA helicase, partial [Rhodocyclaceae bacterium]
MTERAPEAPPTRGPPARSVGEARAPKRRPPCDIEAERSTLSACLTDRASLLMVLDILRPKHFFDDKHQAVFDAIVELAEVRRIRPDTITVLGLLQDRNQERRAGGKEYLDELIDAVALVPNVQAYAQRIFGKWKLREYISLARRIEMGAAGDVDDVDAFGDAIERDVRAIVSASRSGRKPVHIATIVSTEADRAWRRSQGLEVPDGISTGFERIDRKTAGLQTGNLYLIAARPGMGKTAFLLDMIAMICRPVTQHVPLRIPQIGGGVFSLEMPRSQLGMRSLCSRGRVSIQAWKHNDLQRAEWAAIEEAKDDFLNMPLWIDDEPALTLQKLCAKIRALKADYDREEKVGGCPTPGCGAPLLRDAALGGYVCLRCFPDPATARVVESPPIIERAQKVAVIGIDYLQLMKGRENAPNRNEEIGEISRGLKAAAKELDVAMVALSQLNRAVETRSVKDRRPQMSDLRDSGSLEQDADAIFFIYREEYYKP